MASAEVRIAISDLPKIKGVLDEAAAKIEQLQRECDEWEERYWELLSRCGGTMP